MVSNLLVDRALFSTGVTAIISSQAYERGSAPIVGKERCSSSNSRIAYDLVIVRSGPFSCCRCATKRSRRRTKASGILTFTYILSCVDMRPQARLVGVYL